MWLGSSPSATDGAGRGSAEAPAPVPAKSILYKKHVGGRILYHYVSAHPIPGSTCVQANFEDAYVALLMRHDRENQ